MEEKKKLACHIVRDLLPLYEEQLVSEESRRDLEEHLKECKECNKMHENSLSGNSKEVEDQQEVKNIDIFKKIKVRQRIKVIAFTFLGTVLCISVFVMVFLGMIPANSEEVQVTYEAKKEPNIVTDENGVETEELYYSVCFEFALEEGKVIEVRSKTGEEITSTVYSVKKLPLDDRGEHPEQFSYGIEKPEPFDESDTYTIKYRDKEVTYSLKDIAKECGIQ